MTELTAETPATGIVKTHDYGDSMYYSVICQCGNPDDTIAFNLELEVDAWNIFLNTDFTPKTAYWKRLVNDCSNFENSWLWNIDCGIRSFINGFYHRVMVTWEVWTQGYVKYYQSTVMTEQQALNYAATINQSIEDLRTRRKAMNDKRKEKFETDAEDGC